MTQFRDELGRFAKKPNEDLDHIQETPKSLYLSSTSTSSSSHPSSPISLPNNFFNPMAHIEDNHVKTLNEYLHPARTAVPSCIIFNPNAPNHEFKPGMIQLLPTFHGLENENPYVHVREFEEAVATFYSRPDVASIMRLKFFPFSLKDKAKSWLYSLRTKSIGTWEEMTTLFFNKFFPNHKVMV